jgi:hypothetical protein
LSNQALAGMARLADLGVVSAKHYMLAFTLPEGVPIFSMMMSSKPVC